MTPKVSVAIPFSFVCVLSVIALAVPAVAGEEGRLLWRIGTPDNNTAEFALAPNHYSQFAQDPLFIVGVSQAQRDWPYVQPGPADHWAGSRNHSLSIFFGLKRKPASACRLLVSLADTQKETPPELDIEVNGQRVSKHQMPHGGGDASINGDLSSNALPHRFSLNIEPAMLESGMNEISITTISGSWILYDCVGFEAPAGVKLEPLTDIVRLRLFSPPVLVERGGRLYQPLNFDLRYLGEPADATIEATGAAPLPVKLKAGAQKMEMLIPAVEKETVVSISLKSAGRQMLQRRLTVKPVRKWTVYLLPHSHVDIGYTQLQLDVERKQWNNIDIALDLIDKTAGNPPGSRFKWNSEVLWAVDSYLKQAPAEKQQRLVEAIRHGDFELDALYGNELTALCRPEELLRLCECSQRLAKRCGVKVDSAMISDVPGYTWGIVPALAQAEVKYFSIGPNWCDRIGRTMSTWEDKPFYWLGPDGKSKVLCWIPFMGYALGHTGYRLDQKLSERMAQLEAKGYPYDIVQLRWNVGGDNGHPDAGLADLVKKWNETHENPKMIIATTSEMMREFEKRYGDKLPTFSGDFTPYWEDGAASSARETTLNRAAAERLVQAETLWTMFDAASFPADKFSSAWQNALLYDEHTWGAHNSISQPDVPFVKDQWKIKQAFALDADKESRELLDAALAQRGDKAAEDKKTQAIDVFNTCSWPRGGLVVLSKEQSTVGDVVTLSTGGAVPSQRLSTGELVFVASDIPPLAGRRFIVNSGGVLIEATGRVRAEKTSLRNSLISVEIDPASGAIASLKDAKTGAELCDAKSGIGLNRYYYVLGDKVKEAQQVAGPVKITVKENGPLVASLLVESDAPGCAKWTREYRVVEGSDRVEIINVFDKTAVREKEGCHLGFAFNVHDGVMRMNIPWAVVRPEIDQLPGSCKNWLTVGRWVDVSNDKTGVTCATIDAPLVEVGAITADRIGSQTNPDAWIGKLEPSQTFYSWVMNNHWHTNYRAEQSGPTEFRYVLRPHGAYDALAAERFGVECSQPLLAAPAVGSAPTGRPLVELDSPDVMLTSIRPSADGKAWMVRLFGAAGRAAQVNLRWGDGAPRSIWLSNLAEERNAAVNGSVIAVPAWGIVTLRVERPAS